MPTSSVHVVISPNYAVVQRKNAKPTVLSGISALSIAGGKRFDGNGYKPGQPLGSKFSFGYDAPTSVGVILANGKKFVTSDVERVLLLGGIETDRQGGVRQANELIHRLLSQFEAPRAPGTVAIADQRPTDLISNGVTLDIADRAPTPQTEEHDEFTAKVAARNRALQATGGDDFASQILLAQSGHAALNATANFIRDAPLSITKSILGGSVDVAPGQVVVCARWDGDDVETRPVTVTTGPLNTVPLVGGLPTQVIAYRPFGRVQWGTRSYQFSADFDVGNGCQFTINASSVVLSLGLESNIAANSPPVTMAGMLSFKPCVRTAPITRTLYVDDLGALTTVNLAVPAFSKSCKFLRCNRSDSGVANAQLSAMLVTLMDMNALGAAGAQITFSYPVTTAGPYEPLPVNSIPFPGDTAYVSVYNQTNPSTQSARIVCELEF